MTALHALAGGMDAPPPDGEFEVRYVAEGSGLQHVPLDEAGGVRFEVASPARGFVSYKGQRNFPGLWWSATVGGHVGYESWLERDHLMLLDFDPAVVGISSQPFWLSWSTEEGKVRSHAPDYFARRADGSALVVDCRPLERIKPRDAVKFEATRRACERLGWDYRVVGAVDAMVGGNVRWLSGYRHPRHARDEVTTALLAAFTEPTELMAGVQAVGDPIAVLPVLFHLLWRHELVTDLSVPLHPLAWVSAARRAV
ncbi:TnsA-like heteromeric transposase endonuclease subunit [Streptosporangium sp. NPDC006013]|uniref:TnsA-like heteromeric transposase endonuclease subunit n=1 Tax=Streptosporangium sp. NPDC006013 TaxID=3155596 RepID=UPI0033BCC4A2